MPKCSSGATLCSRLLGLLVPKEGATPQVNLASLSGGSFSSPSTESVIEWMLVFSRKPELCVGVIFRRLAGAAVGPRPACLLCSRQPLRQDLANSELACAIALSMKTLSPGIMNSGHLTDAAKQQEYSARHFKASNAISHSVFPLTLKCHGRLR